MPTAYELLSAEECDDVLVVDLESRKIIIPKNVSILGVEADDETRILHFQIPRYYCGIDLSEFRIRINYENANSEGDLYIVADPVIEDELIKFDWVVGRHAFAKKGDVYFSICLKDVFEGVVKREFNTTFATLPVLEGLETDEAIYDAAYDYINNWRDDVRDDLEDVVSTYVEEHAEELRGPEGRSPVLSVETTEVSAGVEVTMTVTPPEGSGDSKVFTIPRGQKGTGIYRLDFAGSTLDGGENTLTIILDNDTTETLSIFNGHTGSRGPRGYDGVGIDTIINTPSTEDGGVNLVTIELSDGTSQTIRIRNGKAGSPGPKGESITSIERTSGTGAPGTTDTYTITTDAEKTYTFSVYNGKDGINTAGGNGTGDMAKSVYDPQSKNTDIFAYVDEQINSITSVFDTIKDELSTV